MMSDTDMPLDSVMSQMDSGRSPNGSLADSSTGSIDSHVRMPFSKTCRSASADQSFADEGDEKPMPAASPVFKKPLPKRDRASDFQTSFDLANSLSESFESPQTTGRIGFERKCNRSVMADISYLQSSNSDDSIDQSITSVPKKGFRKPTIPPKSVSVGSENEPSIKKLRSKENVREDMEVNFIFEETVLDDTTESEDSLKVVKPFAKPTKRPQIDITYVETSNSEGSPDSAVISPGNRHFKRRKPTNELGSLSFCNSPAESDKTEAFVIKDLEKFKKPFKKGKSGLLGDVSFESSPKEEDLPKNNDDCDDSPRTSKSRRLFTNRGEKTSDSSLTFEESCEDPPPDESSHQSSLNNNESVSHEEEQSLESSAYEEDIPGDESLLSGKDDEHDDEMPSANESGYKSPLKVKEKVPKEGNQTLENSTWNEENIAVEHELALPKNNSDHDEPNKISYVNDKSSAETAAALTKNEITPQENDKNKSFKSPLKSNEKGCGNSQEGAPALSQTPERLCLNRESAVQRNSKINENELTTEGDHSILMNVSDLSCNISLTGTKNAISLREKSIGLIPPPEVNCDMDGSWLVEKNCEVREGCQSGAETLHDATESPKNVSTVKGTKNEQRQDESKSSHDTNQSSRNAMGEVRINKQHPDELESSNNANGSFHNVSVVGEVTTNEKSPDESKSSHDKNKSSQNVSAVDEGAKNDQRQDESKSSHDTNQSSRNAMGEVRINKQHPDELESSNNANGSFHNVSVVGEVTTNEKSPDESKSSHDKNKSSQNVSAVDEGAKNDQRQDESKSSHDTNQSSQNAMGEVRINLQPSDESESSHNTNESSHEVNAVGEVTKNEPRPDESESSHDKNKSSQNVRSVGKVTTIEQRPDESESSQETNESSQNLSAMGDVTKNDTKRWSVGKSFYDNIPLSSTVMVVEEATTLLSQNNGSHSDLEDSAGCIQKKQSSDATSDSNTSSNRSHHGSQLAHGYVTEPATLVASFVKSPFAKRDRSFAPGVTLEDGSKTDVQESQTLSAKPILTRKDREVSYDLSFTEATKINHTAAPEVKKPFKSKQRSVSARFSLSQVSSPSSFRSPTTKKNKNKSLRKLLLRKICRSKAMQTLSYLESEPSSLNDPSVCSSSKTDTSPESSQPTNNSGEDMSQSQEESVNHSKEDVEETNLLVENITPKLNGEEIIPNEVNISQMQNPKDITNLNASHRSDLNESRQSFSTNHEISPQSRRTTRSRSISKTSFNDTSSSKTSTSSTSKRRGKKNGKISSPERVQSFGKTKNSSSSFSNGASSLKVAHNNVTGNNTETPRCEKGFRRQVRNKFLENIDCSYIDSSSNMSDKPSTLMEDSIPEEESREKSSSEEESSSDESAKENTEVEERSEDDLSKEDAEEKKDQPIQDENEDRSINKTVVSNKGRDTSLGSRASSSRLDYSQPVDQLSAVHDPDSSVDEDNGWPSIRISTAFNDIPKFKHEPHLIKPGKTSIPLLQDIYRMEISPLDEDSFLQELLAWKKDVEENTKSLQEQRKDIIQEAINTVTQIRKRKAPAKQHAAPKFRRVAVKLKKPARWATAKLYDYLRVRLQPEFGIRTNLKAEEIVEKLYQHVNFVLKSKNHEKSSIDEIKLFLAQHKVVKTTLDFYNFIRKFLPREFEEKVVPSVQPFTNIVWPPNNTNKSDLDPIL